MKRLQLFYLVVVLSLLCLDSITFGRRVYYEYEESPSSNDFSYKDHELTEQGSNSYSMPQYEKPSYYPPAPAPAPAYPPKYAPAPAPAPAPSYYPLPPAPPPLYVGYQPPKQETYYATTPEPLRCAAVNVTQSNEANISGSILGDVFGLLGLSDILGSLLNGLNLPVG